jgi:hypothetical protein
MSPVSPLAARLAFAASVVPILCLLSVGPAAGQDPFKLAGG